MAGGQQGKKIWRLIADRQGSMLPIGAAGLFVLVAMVGSGVDMSRAYRAQQRLQAACDAGVLAARRSVTSTGFTSAVETTARTYFNNNFDPAKQEATQQNFTPTSPDNGNTINATATASVNSAIMKIFGFGKFDLSVSCTAAMGVGNSDVTMVLDTTGSMAQPATSDATTSKIEDLRAAMKNFYATLKSATAAGNARIRYAFVPYSTTTNVGRLLYDLNPAYIADTTPVQSRTAITKPVTTQVFDHWGTPVKTTRASEISNFATTSKYANYGSNTYTRQSDCIAALPSETWNNNGSASVTYEVFVNSAGQQESRTKTVQPQTGTVYQCAGNKSSWRIQSASAVRDLTTYTNVTVADPVYRDEVQQVFDYWRYQRVNFDTSTYKSSTPTNYPMGSNGAVAAYTWGGCVEERETTTAATFSFSTITGISSGTRSDLDIDTAPDTSVPATLWKPMMESVAYYRTDSGGNRTANNTSLYGRQASAPCPYQARLFQTYPDQASFDAYADALSTGGNTYHDIGMIWGGRLSSPDGIWSSLVNSPPGNGGQVTRHLIFMTDGDMMPNDLTHSAYGIEWHDRRTTTDGYASTDRHNSRFLAVCEEVKSKGIRIWVIAFSSALTTQLTTCASPDSAFLATDAAELNNVFQQIAIKVGELRVTQ